MLTRPLVTLFAFALVVALSACEDVSVTQATVAALEVDPEAASIQLNQTVQLSATAFAASGAPLPGRTAEWAALDPEVATVDESGLVRGVATGSARIRATIGGRSATASIQVGSSPQIALSQPTVELSAPAGGSTTQPVTVAVTNGGGGSLTGLGTSIAWVEGAGGWLEVTLSGTSAPTTLSLRATPGSLAPGRYEAEVTVTPSGSGATPGTLAVVFEISEPPPSIGLSLGAVGFASSERQGAPPSQTVRITNGGGGSVTGLDASISYPSGGTTGWLAATLDGSSAPTDLVLRVDPQGLATGVHDAEVRITASGGVQAVVLQVRYRYGEAPPEFAVSPGTVSRTVEEHASPPAPDTVRITNAGTGTLDGIELNIEYSGSERGWIDARLSWSRAPALLLVTMDPEGLPPGTYEARARLASSAAVNSPATVLLQLRVEPRAIRPSASNSTLNANPRTVKPDQPSTLLVRLRDAAGNIMTTGGDEIFLTTSLGSLSRTSGTTDDSGRFTATLTSNSLGSAVVSAYLGSSAADPLIGSTTVTIAPEGGSEADASQSTLEADPSRFTTDESSEIEIQLRDTEGNALTTGGDPIFLTTSLGSLSRTSGTTDDNGRFTATLSSNSPGSAVVSAYLGSSVSDPLIGSTTVTVAPVEGTEADADESTLEADPSRFATDEFSAIEIQLRDADGDDLEVEGLAIFLATTIGELDRTSGTSDDDGKFETRLRSSTVGTGTVTAYLGTDAGDPSIGSVEIRVDPGDASAEASTIEATSAEITEGESAPIVIQLRDTEGNALTTGGDPIFLTTSLGSLSRTSGTTDDDGRFTATLSSNSPGSAVVSAYLGSSSSDPPIGSTTVTFAPVEGNGEADADESTLEADPSRFTTDESSEIEIQLRDAEGKGLKVEGLHVFLVTTIGELDRTSGTSDDDGEFETTLTSSTVGTGTVTAYLGTSAGGPSIGSVEIRVEPGDVSAEGSTIEATPDEITAWETSSIVVQLRDAAGNAIREDDEDIYLRTSGGRLSRTTGETDRDGRFVATLEVNPSDEGTVTITAWLGDDDDDDRIGSVQVRVTR